jgi:hypothetical protein
MPTLYSHQRRGKNIKLKIKPLLTILSCVTVALILMLLNFSKDVVEDNDIVSSIVHMDLGAQGSKCTPKKGLRPITGERFEIGDLLEELKLETGVEVGVKEGVFSLETLKRWKSCKSYKLVDLWSHQKNYKDVANVPDAKHNQFYEETKRKLKPYANITNYYKMYSAQAAKLFEKESFDFVYIDARHDYCGVMEDLEAYWPLLKPGGVLAGDDYASNDQVRGQDWGLCMNGTRIDSAVKGAVHDFLLPKGLTISLTREKRLMNWFVQKPSC